MSTLMCKQIEAKVQNPQQWPGGEKEIINYMKTIEASVT